VWVSAKGGQTVPLKFNVYAGDVKQTNVSAIKVFTLVKMSACVNGAVEAAVEEFATTGKTELRYDGTGGQFVQNWATPKVSTDTCYRASVIFADDSSLSAFFKVRK
jgi:hypothetical protein